MADVLIVCVREDELQAKALADMFERAGFSVGGAPASDAALRSTGAGVIVWSQASIRSRPFLDAAQRVIDVEKAVVASLIDPPPPHTIGEAPAFALNGWTGDPEDPALDPLFFAVDRMVNSQRAALGASPARPAAAFEEPPSLRPPPPPAYARRHEPPAAREPARPPQFDMRPRTPEPARDPLGAEAEHWRAIRDSRDPADFMDYLARYGAQGAFSEVAELRLKQLTASQPTSLREAARAAEPPRARRPDPPPPRPEPPRRVEPPVRLEQRRPDPPPPPRRREQPAHTRDYHSPPAEPVRSGGGLARMLILVLLLGGGALAAGLYFGEGQQNQTAAQASDLNAPTGGETPLGEPSEMGVGGEENAEEPVELASVSVPPPRREAAVREREAAPRAAPTPEAEPPAPTTSWTEASNNAAPGGPISLAPGQSANLPAAPPAAPALTPTSTPEPAAAAPAGSVRWAQRPSARRVSELYPERASQNGASGRAELNCTVRADLSLACSVANETPGGNGFGRAALAAAASYRAQPTLSNGAAAAGARARIAVTFQAPPD